ncbi:hypothetical protein PhCBS80983_g02589 [Powellomyces hirtus]|uniref:Uncharacterized protein n=1 Tax=Powellomyces hirtus TaxID=109895 RepID=A0A507E5X6_9FUNG|nr:hypothetical protein PhCBS80983_g02589 [Powellomyces hirtus]
MSTEPAKESHAQRTASLQSPSPSPPPPDDDVPSPLLADSDLGSPEDVLSPQDSGTRASAAPERNLSRIAQLGGGSSSRTPEEATSTSRSTPSITLNTSKSATTPAIRSPLSYGTGSVPESPRPAKRRKKQYYLQITISEAKRGALPGYEGDRRVEWAVSDDATSLVESAEKTRDALVTLKEFWDDVAPEELGFSEFVWCVFGDDFADTAVETDPAAPAKHQTPSSDAAAELTAHMAARLAGNTMALSAFLADVRDWDAFRLLIRRRAGRLPVTLAARGQERRRRAKAAREEQSSPLPSTSSSHRNSASMRDEAVRMLASEAFFYVLAEKEAEWDAQRVALEAALASAERKVQRIVHSVTGALGGAIGEIPLHRTAHRTDSCVRRSLESLRAMDHTTNPYELFSPARPTPSTFPRQYRSGAPVTPPGTPKAARKNAPPPRLAKKVSFDMDTLKREEVRDGLRTTVSDDEAPVHHQHKRPLPVDTATQTSPLSSSSPARMETGFATNWRGSASSSLDRDEVVDDQYEDDEDYDYEEEENPSTPHRPDTARASKQPPNLVIHPPPEPGSLSKLYSTYSNTNASTSTATSSSSNSTDANNSTTTTTAHHGGLYQLGNANFTISPDRRSRRSNESAESSDARGRASTSSSTTSPPRKRSCLDFARPRRSGEHGRASNEEQAPHSAPVISHRHNILDTRTSSSSLSPRPRDEPYEEPPTSPSFGRKVGRFLKFKASRDGFK